MSRFRPGPLVRAWRGFLDSFSRPKRDTGVEVGKDPFGNTYYEIPADPSRGKRRPVRWYINVETNKKDVIGVDRWAGFDAELPTEWESWLRMRRNDPPTEDQVMQSLALADLKKRNAAKLEAKHTEELIAAGREVYDETKPMDHEKPFYPKYEEYEILPGQESKDKDRWKDFKNPYSEKNEK